jgi:prevent-host-death family protein
MKTATVTEAKNRLSALIDQVKAGESVTITDRGTPVARLEPVASRSQDGRLLRLSRAGIIRLPQQADVRGALASAPPARTVSESAVAAVLDERRTGR